MRGVRRVIRLERGFISVRFSYFSRWVVLLMWMQWGIRLLLAMVASCLLTSGVRKMGGMWGLRESIWIAPLSMNCAFAGFWRSLRWEVGELRVV
jgi:hypothetical protein